MNARKPKGPVAEALREVQRHFPHCCYVLYHEDGTWTFLDNAGEAPDFSKTDIDVSTLEQAADWAYEQYALPVLFFDPMAWAAAQD